MSDETKHSPGPWRVEADESLSPFRNDVWRIVSQQARADRRKQGTSARPAYLATVYNSADARLIASAPTLADQNRRMREVLRGTQWANDGSCPRCLSGGEGPIGGHLDDCPIGLLLAEIDGAKPTESR